jgi:hypothetical protein
MAATPGANDDGFLIVNAVLALSETADLLRTLDASPLSPAAGPRHRRHESAHPARVVQVESNHP